ncbi:MAG: methyltransferase domain-containing protein [Patulibacter minatonensis]
MRDQRLDTVEAAVRSSGAKRVLDLGCGSGALMRRLMKMGLDELVGVDISVPALEKAHRYLKLDELSDERRARIQLLQGALTYRDVRLTGYDAAVLQEVIEHLDEPRLEAAVSTVFGYAKPTTVIVTTPNAEYNVRWDSLPAGEFRHRDHRFEWTRPQFAGWAQRVADAHGYSSVAFHPIGPVDDEVGSPTQMAVFTR